MQSQTAYFFVIIITSQVDLSSKRVVGSKDAQKWAKAHDFRYYETSALNGQGVHEMFSDVITAAVEAKLVKAKPVINSEQSKHR